MALKIGNNAVANAFVGTSQVRRAYKGGTLVYQGFGPASEQEFIQQEATGGPAQLLKVYGKSIVWNQQANLDSQTEAFHGLTVTAINGHIQISGTATLSSGGRGVFGSISWVQGHIYYVKFTGTSSGITVYFRGPSGITLSSNASLVTASSTTSYAYTLLLIYNEGAVCTADIDCCVVDLTALTGVTTVAEYEALYGSGYYPYDPGSLQSNKTAELRAERVPIINVWDEEWELGRITNEGEPADSTTQIRTKNFIPVLGGQSYYYKIPDTAGGTYMAFAYFYDEGKSFISRIPVGPSSYLIRVTPSNACYMRFELRNNYGTTYNHDICINLSDPAINGNYYPHWRGSLALNLSTLTGKLNGEGASVVVFPDGLRGVGTDRDEAYGSTGVVRLGKRAYQTGDESDTSVLTDGTNTIYPLATPLTYTLDTPLPTDLTCEQGDILQRVSDNNCPFVGEMKFGL